MHHVILLISAIHIFFCVMSILPLIYIVIILYQHFSNLFYGRVL